MNAPLRRLSVAVMLLFGLLLVNVNYLQVVRADDLHNDGNNPRLIAEEYSRERGPILVAGKPVASSKATDDRLKYLRQYSDGELYAPATGFYSLVYGSSGIEREANSILSGTDDALFVRRVIDLLTGTSPKGGSVALTLDPQAQKAAFDGLAGRRGAVVAIDPTTGALLREHRRQARGRHAIHPADQPPRTPPTTLALLARAARTGAHVGTLCEAVHRRDGERSIRRILGVLALAKRYGAAVVEDACGAALDLGVADYRFVRRFLERRAPAPLTLRQVDPLIRQLTHYRDVIARKTQEVTP